MKLSFLLRVLLIVLFFAGGSASAGEPGKRVPGPLIEMWIKCEVDADCDAVPWDACTMISVNSKFSKEVADTVKLEQRSYSSRSEPPPPDEVCVRGLREFVTEKGPPACEKRRCIFRTKKPLKRGQYGIIMTESYRVDYIKPPKPEAEDEEAEEEGYADESSDEGGLDEGTGETEEQDY